MVDLRWIELVVLYVVTPVTLAWAFERFSYRRAMAPLLWVASAVAIALLLRDPSFDREALFRMPLADPYVWRVAVRFCALAVPVLALGRWLTPHEFLRLPRQRPGLWLALAVLYPLLSAVPQGILYRVYFAQQFGALFENRLLFLAAGALVFSLGHVVFRNVPALVLTAIGGALFFDTYLHTHSMLLAAAEHGAYGVVAFTAGLGRFLYLGARPGAIAPPAGLARGA
jgi:hypothetical protein